MTTAAHAIDSLFERLVDQKELRMIDLTLRRRLSGTQLAMAYRKARSNVAAAGLTPETPTLFAIRPSSRALTNLCGLLNLGVPTMLTDLELPGRLIRSQMTRLSVSHAITEPLISLLARRPLRQMLSGHIEVPALHEMASEVITTRPRLPGKLTMKPPHAGDTAVVVFTSGTTDAPKAVCHTQESLADTFSTLAAMMGDVDGVVVYSEMLHSSLPALAAGAQCVIGSPSITDNDLAGALVRHKVDVWFTTPSRALRVARLLGDRLPSHLILGSAPVNAALVEDLHHHKPGGRVTAVYGMTEAVPIAVAEEHDILSHSGPGDLVGAVVDGIEISIDEHSEIWIRGRRVGRHLDSPPGWIPTGDLGRTDSQGKLILDGRSKDMILSNSRNIYPQHYEPTINALEGIIDSALIGIPDEHGNESVWVLVESEGDTKAIVESLRAQTDIQKLDIRGLAFATLPRGRQGKLDRKACRSLIESARDKGIITDLSAN